MALAFLLIAVYSLVIIGDYALPDSVEVYSSKKVIYNSMYHLNDDRNAMVDFQGNSRVSPENSTLELFGFIPVKDVSVSQKHPKKVYVSGESFGIKLYTDGVIVVGTKDVETDSEKCNPAREAGIEKGDIIIEINGKKVYSSDEVTSILNDNNGKDYRIRIKRNGSYKNFILSPVYSKKEGCFKVGLWVRDSTAGIGTVTFYNPSNNTVAALGHPITDVDTNEIMPILNGEAVKAKVTKVYKGRAGEAGALCCDFSNDVIGTLNDNSKYGIYGKYNCDIDKSYLYEIAAAQEVEKGPAQILCTVDDGPPRLYSVEITKVSFRENNNERNMVVKIVDKELLEKTGGIVQGMSGSPIIQNGKLIGAVTHVIVDDPCKGYAIFAQKMVEQSETISN